MPRKKKVERPPQIPEGYEVAHIHRAEIAPHTLLQGRGFTVTFHRADGEEPRVISLNVSEWETFKQAVDKCIQRKQPQEIWFEVPGDHDPDTTNEMHDASDPRQSPTAGNIGECIKCGEAFELKNGLIPTHDYPKPCRQICIGSNAPPKLPDYQSCPACRAGNGTGKCTC